VCGRHLEGARQTSCENELRKLKVIWVEIIVNIKKIKFKIDNKNLNQNFKNH
jgi:hypothetical protein